MNTSIDTANRLCKIWVSYEEKNTYRKSEEFKRVLKICKDGKLTPCVFIGGSQPLLPTISNLLEQQGPMKG